MAIPPPASHIDQATLRQIIATHTGTVLVEKPWQCDVINAHADLIELHNVYRQQQGHRIEAKFAGLDSKPQYLRDLLWEDYSYLAQGARLLGDIADWFLMAEVSGPYPNMENLTLEHSGGTLTIVCFKSQLLQFIHSGFSKIWVLTSNYRHADCLPQHDHILESSRYSDTSLLAGLFNDIERLFDQNRLFLPFDPPHMADPYDYCERVQGARRFLLAHELAHSISGDAASLPKIADRAERRRRGANAAKWDEEIWCDAFAVHAILNRYAQHELTGPPLYELEGALVGIMTLFILLEVVEVPLRSRRILPEMHPPHRLRLQAFREIVRRHPLYNQSEALRNTLNRNWRRLHSFRKFAGGVGAPIAFGEVWSWIEFRQQLTPFGEQAYRSLFDETVWEWKEIHRCDTRSFNQDLGDF